MSEIKYIDIHAHLNFPDYDIDREEVIKRAYENGVAIINIGTEVGSSKQVLELADKFREIHPHIYSIPGIHPTKVQDALKELPPEPQVTEEGELLSSDQKKLKIILKIDALIDKWLEELDQLADHKSVVGIGECGIDMFRFKTDEPELKDISYDGVFALQRKLFIGQIEIARKRDIPIMIHARESYTEILSILDENFISKGLELRGNVHFFAGTPAEARMFLDRGFTLSFTGVITFAREYAKTIAELPLEKIMSETDCPFVSPMPYRGKRNEPSYVIEVVKKMAEIRGLQVSDIAPILLENACQAFKLRLN